MFLVHDHWIHSLHSVLNALSNLLSFGNFNLRRRSLRSSSVEYKKKKTKALTYLLMYHSFNCVMQ